MVAAILAVAKAVSSGTSIAKEFEPYGAAKVDMHPIAVRNVVFDVNYEDPQ